MFYSLSSQIERRKFGGSDFLEIQFCKMLSQTSIEIITAVDSITHWLNDSLYIYGDDINTLLQEYVCVFDSGIYNNIETGMVYPFGINYYGPDLIDSIRTKLLEMRPTDYEKLAEWLNRAKKYNGFYILGE